MKAVYPKKPSISAVDYVIEAIKNLLLQGELKPGDKLPNEDELSKLLGVSRGSVRSAMKVFATCGVVDIRVGDGTYVCTSLNNNSLNPIIMPMLILQPDLETLATFREKVEYDIIELIIGNPKNAQAILPLLDDNLEKLKQLQIQGGNIENFVQNDVAFHRILGHQCGNVVFETVYNQLMEYFVPFITSSHKHQNYGAASDISHGKIYNAIKKSDLALAYQAIKDSNTYWRSSVEQ